MAESIQLWPDKEAAQILKKHGDDADKTYVFETGFGPSGKPHFGTFGEVVRTNYVMLAMQDRGYKTKLIAFSDDLDGLRKVPQGFPAWLKDHIGKPVSAIPDPFDEHESFSAHMNALLVQMLEDLGLTFEFRSSAEAYQSGVFNEQIAMVIRDYEGVQDIIFPYLREETKEHWFPFFPICENCGRVGTTRVIDVNKDDLLLTYKCDREFGGVDGCGHEGTISALDGNGKLQWKVDWPARWHAFGVNYEMFGKDLIESAEVGDRIVQRIFKGKPPTHMFYEMFLDEDGTKISKSVGRGMDADLWQRYGSLESLMYLMLDKPREAKKLYAGIVPRYMDLTAKAAEGYFTGDEKLARDARHYQFITLFSPPTDAPISVDYGTLSNLVGNVGLSDPAIVEEYLQRNDLLPKNISGDQRQALYTLIEQATRFYDEVMSLDTQAPQLDAEDGFLLGKLVAYLESGEVDADTLHNELFQIPKRHDVEPRKFFQALYSALIKQERGPRGGQFIKLLGQDTAAQLIRQRIAESVAGQDMADDEDRSNDLQPIHVVIHPDVAAAYPEISIAAAIISGVKISSKRPDELDQLILAAIEQRQDIALDDALEKGAIGAYRQFFEQFGVNPNAMPPSPETILRMAVNDARLPAVNNLVDAANLTVLETGISVALYDFDKIDTALTLRFSTNDDKHIPIGAKQYEPLKSGELVYADNTEIICRALNHRDSDKTKITGKTQSVLLIVDGGQGIKLGEVMDAFNLHLQRITTYAGGHVEHKTILLG